MTISIRSSAQLSVLTSFGSLFVFYARYFNCLGFVILLSIVLFPQAAGSCFHQNALKRSRTLDYIPSVKWQKKLTTGRWIQSWSSGWSIFLRSWFTNKTEGEGTWLLGMFCMKEQTNVSTMWCERTHDDCTSSCIDVSQVKTTKNWTFTKYLQFRAKWTI